MRVVHFTSSKGSAAGGIATVVAALQKAQNANGIASSWRSSDEGPRHRKAAPLVQWADSVGADVVHSHGLWLAPSRAARRLAKRGTPLLVAPHGMLDPWAWQRRRVLKRALWAAGERETIQRAGCLHALCVAEAEAIRRLGIDRPIAIIPNGIDPPEQGAEPPPPPWTEEVPRDAKVLLFLGRLHEKKGIAQLLDAWQSVAQVGECQDWWLVLVGYGDGGQTAKRVAEQRISRCAVYGPAFGAAKAGCFAHADGFVLPSFSEGLPMAVLEAWSYGLPSLISPFCNLPEAFEHDAALRVEPTVDSLVAMLPEFCGASPTARAQLGSHASRLANERFTWTQVVKQTQVVYRWLAGAGPAPENLY